MDEDGYDEEDKEADDDERDQRDREEDEETRRQMNPRVDNDKDLILALTRPTVRRKYAKFVSRDLNVSNIPKGAEGMLIMEHMRRTISLINDFIFLNSPEFPTLEMADVYNSDLKAHLSLLRSVGGFERKQQTTITNRKERYSTDSDKSNKWGLSK